MPTTSELFPNPFDPPAVTAPLPSLEADAAALAELGDGWDRRFFQRAACDGADEALFFPGRGTTPHDAIDRYCSTCPVRLDCLAHGARSARLPGVLGGRSRNQRKQLARHLGLAATVTDGGDLWY